MQTHHFRQKFNAAMYLDEYLTSNVSKSAKIRNRYNQVPHLTQDTKPLCFLQNRKRSQKYPTPYPKGPGINMQYFPNTVILLGGLNAMFKCKHKIQLSSIHNSIHMLSKFWQIK